MKRRLRPALPALLTVLAVLPLGACDDGVTVQDDPDLVLRASVAGTFVQYLVAADATGFISTLRQPGPYTLFLPTDLAFQQLPESTLERLGDDQDYLLETLRNHVVPGSYTLNEAFTAGTLEALTGREIDVTLESTSGTIRIDGARVVFGNGEASNGVLHGIDQVLLPDEEEPGGSR